jgi:acid stress-induced BolA-like protein IbaG/YrbA
MYGCEPWSLTRTEEHKLKVYVKRVLREIFGPKKVEVRGDGENYTMKIM